MAQKPETRFKEKVFVRLREEFPGAWFTKVQQVVIRGTPDVLGCINGRALAIELKTDSGKADPLQDYELNGWRRAGAIALVMSPATLEKDIETLKEVQHPIGQ